MVDAQRRAALKGIGAFLAGGPVLSGCQGDGNTYDTPSEDDSYRTPTAVTPAEVAKEDYRVETIETGNKDMLTVCGREYSLEGVAAVDEDSFSYTLNGEYKATKEGGTIPFNGQDAIVDNVIQTDADNSEGFMKLLVPEAGC